MTSTFPKVALAELCGKVERLGRELGRFEKIRVRQLSESIFRIDQ